MTRRELEILSDTKRTYELELVTANPMSASEFAKVDWTRGALHAVNYLLNRFGVVEVPKKRKKR